MVSQEEARILWEKYDSLIQELGEGVFLEHFKDKVFDELGFDRFSSIIDSLSSIFLQESKSKKEKVVDSLLFLLGK